MSKPNAQIWEELPSESYLKTGEAAAIQFRDMANFPGSVGFDPKSSGFLAIHKGHAPSGLAAEIPVCVFLKKCGFRVILQDESLLKKSPDCKINDLDFEMKQIAQTKSIHRAIIAQARKGYSKCDRLLIHICQPANLKQLEGGITAAVQLYKSIKTVWLVKGNSLFLYDFATKKLKGTAH